MNGISRRSFVGKAAAGFAVLAAPAAAVEGEEVYRTADWKMSSFEEMLKEPFEVKQMVDVTAIDDGNAFDHMVNSLNGLQFGFGIPAAKIKIVGALRAMATVMNYNDAIWEKYRVGEWLKINDPKTGKPATRNIFYASAAGNPPKYTSDDPNNDASMYQDTSIQALQGRGMQLLACHLAIQAQAGGIIERLKLKQPKEEIVQELQSNLLPGVMVMPSMVSAIDVLQSKGRFTYLRM